MPKYSIRKLAIGAVALVLIAGFTLVDSNAQKRRRKRRASAPRITNPAIYQPSANDNSNTTGDASNTSENANTQNAKPPEDPEEMKKTIRSLSSQVDKLTDKLSQMQEEQRSLVDLERLSRAEQRSAQLHAEMRDVQAKEAELQARLEDITYALKPENIERATAGVGSTHPEEVREQRRKQLEAEKQRVQSQLNHLAASQTNLEQASAAADTEVDRLRKKLDAADQAAIENAKRKSEVEGASQSSKPYSSPTPTPSP